MILQIETATEFGSVALSHQGKTLFLKEMATPNAHAAQLTSIIQEILAEAGILAKELTAIAISSGPGSYTGLRIAASVAKGMCYALSCPLIAIPTLDALADAAIQKYQDIDALYIPMIDARRMEVYTAIFDAGGKKIKKIQPIIINTTFWHQFCNTNETNKNMVFCGNGAIKLQNIDTKTNVIFLDIKTSAANLSSLAWLHYQQNTHQNLAYFEPIYLKEANITSPKRKD
jgi:tRNA threonylcarbamoyladenosine biosynthesis protein TsaB